MFRAVTVTMNAEFIGRGPIGKFIEATGETTKIGRSLLFARGMISCEGEALLSFSGSLKRFG
jgi:acyl-coenzyme A thioesterase PaaI-like protein